MMATLKSRKILYKGYFLVFPYYEGYISWEVDLNCDWEEIYTRDKRVFFDRDFNIQKEASADISTISILRKPWSRMYGHLSQVALISEKTVLQFALKNWYSLILLSVTLGNLFLKNNNFLFK